MVRSFRMRCAVEGCSPVRSLISFRDTGPGWAASTSSSAKHALQDLDGGCGVVFGAGSVMRGVGPSLPRSLRDFAWQNVKAILHNGRHLKMPLSSPATVQKCTEAAGRAQVARQGQRTAFRPSARRLPAWPGRAHRCSRPRPTARAPRAAGRRSRACRQKVARFRPEPAAPWGRPPAPGKQCATAWPSAAWPVRPGRAPARVQRR
jgi:hypothetical protein